MRYSAMTHSYNNFTKKMRTCADDIWCFKYDKLKRKPLGFKEECILTAKKIREDTNLPIYVCMSGGLDSTVVAESFRLAGINFTAAIMRFEDSLNYHDIKYAFEYCKRYNIPFKVFDINVEEFLEKNLLEYSIPCHGKSPQWAVQNWLLDQIDGYPIFGNGPPLTWKGEHPVTKSQGIKTTEWSLDECESAQTMEWWLEYRGNREGCIRFFRYTTEIKVASLIDPVMVDWMSKYKNEETMSIYEYKNDIYNKWFPNLGTRPFIWYPRFKGTERIIRRTDYTGFEYMSEIDRKYRKILSNIFSDAYDTYIVKTVIEHLRELCKGQNFMDDIIDEVNNKIN